jgi:hypothetical protein
MRKLRTNEPILSGVRLTAIGIVARAENFMITQYPPMSAAPHPELIEAACPSPAGA